MLGKSGTGWLAAFTALAVTAIGAGSASAANGPLALEWVPASSQPGSPPSASATATCPQGMRLVGTGGKVAGGFGQVLLEDITPDAALTRVTVTAREAQDGDAWNGTWTVRAYAICAFGVAGLERVSAPSELNSRAKGKLVFCPSGKVVIGTGADVDGPAGQVGLAHITPQESLVSAGAREDADGTTANWSMRVYAICASPIDGLQRVPAYSGVLDLDPAKAATATCPTGKRVVGTGGDVDIYGNDDVSAAKGQVLNGIRPDATLSSVTMTAYAGTGAIGTWRAVAVAICSPRGSIGPERPPAPDLEVEGP